MADIDVKKQSSSQGSEGNRQQLERQQASRGASRLSREWDPFGFSLSPAEFFSTNPFTAMRRMSEEMDRAFGQFFGTQGSGSGTRGSWYPAIEVTERDGQLHVHAELPGLRPEDVKVEVTNDALVIHGERKYEQEHQIGKAYRSERRYGEFYREIALPEGVNAEQARAQFRNGVLEISIPVPQQATSRREIPISTGETSGSTAPPSASAAAAGSGSSSSSGSSTNPGSSSQKRT